MRPRRNPGSAAASGRGADASGVRVSRRVTGGARAAVLAIGLVLTSVPSASAQTAEELVVTCVQAGGGVGACAAGAVGARALHGQMGLLGGLGSEVAGTATTLGTRIGGGPRFSVGARGGFTRFSLPDPGDPTGLGAVKAFVPSVHVDAAMGLFDGFRLMPTVGGFLSVDVFGRAAFLLLPTSDGFDGSARAYTVGARVGILREGFTVPGISVSLARRVIDEAAWGDPEGPQTITVDPSVLSARATLGKDLFAVEWLVGVGWDEHGGRSVIRTASGSTAGLVTRVEDDHDAERWLYFGSASMTFGIIFNVAVEGGWATGFDAVPAYAGALDPEGGSFFGSLAFRLIL